MTASSLAACSSPVTRSVRLGLHIHPTGQSRHGVPLLCRDDSASDVKQRRVAHDAGTILFPLARPMALNFETEGFHFSKPARG